MVYTVTTQTLRKQVRFFDIARAFQIIATNPDKALDLAVEVDDDQIRVLESNLHGIAKKLDGDPIAAEIEALLSHPFHEAPPIHAEIPEGAFKWTKTGARGAKDVRFDCEFAGMKLAIVKVGPANYEGEIDGEHVMRGKFKKNVRERVEKEAAKRVHA